MVRDKNLVSLTKKESTMTKEKRSEIHTEQDFQKIAIFAQKKFMRLNQNRFLLNITKILYLYILYRINKTEHFAQEHNIFSFLNRSLFWRTLIFSVPFNLNKVKLPILEPIA